MTACVVRPAIANTRIVTGMMAMRAGRSMAPSSAYSSMTPAAAGTKSNGKIPVRKIPVVRTCSNLTTPVQSAAKSSSKP